MTKSFKINSPSKLNWILHVGPIRPDGYHELLTVFQELSLVDPMEFTSLPNDEECRLSGFPSSIPAEGNLVTKAWQLMKSLYPGQVGGLDVKITKNIPMGGGLGGGSANAACTLNALNGLYDLSLSPQKLEEIGGRLGSDVSFFIQGGAASATGRGEILQQLDHRPLYYLVLDFQREAMSTGEAYKALDSMQRVSFSTHNLFNFLTEWHSCDPLRLSRAVSNDFELIAETYTWYRDSTSKLLQAGALKTLLCGSGSTVCGIARDADHAREIAEKSGGIFIKTA